MGLRFRIFGIENMEICNSPTATPLFYKNKHYKNTEAETGKNIRTEEEHFEARKI